MQGSAVPVDPLPWGLYSYDLYSYGVYSYDLYSYGLYSHCQLWPMCPQIPFLGADMHVD